MRIPLLWAVQNVSKRYHAFRPLETSKALKFTARMGMEPLQLQVNGSCKPRLRQGRKLGKGWRISHISLRIASVQAQLLVASSLPYASPRM